MNFLKNIWVRKIGCFACLLCFSLQSLFASLGEANLWSDRRKSTRLARLSTPILPSYSHLPLLEKGSAQTRLNPRFSNLPNNLGLLLENGFGTVRNISTPIKSSLPTYVIHIQDIHDNFEAQKNIAAAIKMWVEKDAMQLLALEGACQPISLQPLRRYHNRDAVLKVADYFLRTHQISGPIFAALETSSEIPHIVGIDDAHHYQKNVEAVKKALPDGPRTRRWLNKKIQHLHAQRSLVLNSELRRFDEKIDAYHQATMPIASYIDEIRPPSGDLSQEVQQFQKALQLEARLDFSKVELERSHLIHTLTEKCTSADIQLLSQISLEFRSGRLSPFDFYLHLKGLCRQKNIPLNRFPHMAAYLEYIVLSDSIDGERLFQELSILEAAKYSFLMKNEAEKELIENLHHLRLTQKLVDFSLSKDEWNKYRSFSSKNNGVDLSPFEQFYEEAAQRDTAMARHLLNVIQTHKPSISVLVTGGFHSAGIRQQLLDSGVTVISFVPRLTKVEDEKPSATLSVFAQEKTPLQKLFEGEKLFLSKAPLPESIQTLGIPAGTLLFEQSQHSSPLPSTHLKEAMHTMGTPSEFELETSNLKTGARGTLTGPAGQLTIDLHSSGSDVGGISYAPAAVMSFTPWSRMLTLAKQKGSKWAYFWAGLGGFLEEWGIRYLAQGLLFPLLSSTFSYDLSPLTSNMVYAALFATVFHIQIIDSFGQAKSGWLLRDRLVLFLLSAGLGYFDSYFAMGLFHAVYNILVVRFRLPLPMARMISAPKRKKTKGFRTVDPVEQSFVEQHWDRLDELENPRYKLALEFRFGGQSPSLEEVGKKLGIKHHQLVSALLKRAMTELKALVDSETPSTLKLMRDHAPHLDKLIGADNATALTDFLIHHKTQKDIAKKLGLKPITITHKIQRARELLAEKGGIRQLVLDHQDKLASMIGEKAARILIATYIDWKTTEQIAADETKRVTHWSEESAHILKRLKKAVALGKQLQDKWPHWKDRIGINELVLLNSQLRNNDPLKKMDLINRVRRIRELANRTALPNDLNDALLPIRSLVDQAMEPIYEKIYEERRKIKRGPSVKSQEITIDLELAEQALLRATGKTVLTDREILARGYKFLETLDPTGLLKKILEMRIIRGRFFKDINKELGLDQAPETTEARFHAGLKKLRALVDEYELSEDFFVKQHQYLLPQLPKVHAEFLAKHFIEAKSLSDIAREYGRTHSTIRSLKNSAMNSLRTQVEIAQTRTRLSKLIQDLISHGLDMTKPFDQKKLGMVNINDNTLRQGFIGQSELTPTQKIQILDKLKEAHFVGIELGMAGDGKTKKMSSGLDPLTAHAAQHYNGRESWKNLRVHIPNRAAWEKLKKENVRGVSMEISIDGSGSDIEIDIEQSLRPILAAIEQHERDNDIAISKHVYLSFSAHSMRKKDAHQRLGKTIQAMRSLGVRMVWLKETSGRLSVKEVEDICDVARAASNLSPFSREFTMGWQFPGNEQSLALTLAAFRKDYFWFDTSLGGIGGLTPTEDLVFLLTALGAPKLTMLEVLTTACRHLDKFTSGHISRQETSLKLFRLPEIKSSLAALLTFSKGQISQWQKKLGILKSLKIYENPAIGFNVKTSPKIPFEERTPNDETTRDSIRMSKERLPDLIARHVTVSTKHGESLYIPKWPRLDQKISELWLQGNHPEAHRLLREYFLITSNIFQRGVINWNMKLENFGVDEAGQVYLIDFGTLEEANKYEANGTGFDNYIHSLGVSPKTAPDDLYQLSQRMKAEFRLDTSLRISRQIPAEVKNEKRAVSTAWLIPMGLMSFTPWSHWFIQAREKGSKWAYFWAGFGGFLEEAVLRYGLQAVVVPWVLQFFGGTLSPWMSAIIYSLLFATIFHWKIINSRGELQSGVLHWQRFVLFLLSLGLGGLLLILPHSFDPYNITPYLILGGLHWIYNHIVVSWGLNLPMAISHTRTRKPATTLIDPEEKAFVVQYSERIGDIGHKTYEQLLRLRYLQGLSQEEIGRQLGITDPSKLNLYPVFKKAFNALKEVVYLGRPSIRKLVSNHKSQLETLVSTAHAKILTLKYVRNKTNPQIKKILNLSEHLVIKRLAEAETNLLKALNLHGDSDKDLVNKNVELLEFIDPNPNMAKILELAFVGVGKTDYAIGQIIGIPASTVHKMKQTGLKRLRHRVESDIPSDYENVKKNWDLVARLKPRYRDILLFYYRDQKSDKEIAQRITKPGEKVPSHRAINYSRQFALRALNELIYLKKVKARIDETLMDAIRQDIDIDLLTPEIGNQIRLNDTTLNNVPDDQYLLSILDELIVAKLGDTTLGVFTDDMSEDEIARLKKIVSYANSKYKTPEIRKGLRVEIKTSTDWQRLLKMMNHKKDGMNIRSIYIRTQLTEVLDKNDIEKIMREGHQINGPQKRARIIPGAIIELDSKRLPLPLLHKRIEELSTLGIKKFILRDQTGTLSPQDIRTLSSEINKFGFEFAWNFNDQKLGLVKLMMAASEGIRHFDTSLGGLASNEGDISTEDAFLLISALSSLRPAKMRVVQTTTRKLEGFLKKNIVAESQLWGTHRLSQVHLNEITQYLRNRIAQWRTLRGQLQASHHRPMPEIQGDEDFTYTKYPKSKLVKMRPRQPISLHSANLAEERLGGLTAGFVLIPKGQNSQIIMEETKPLNQAIHDLFISGKMEDVEKHLRRYYEVVQAILRRGILNWNSHISHFGINSKGDVVLVNIGQLEHRNGAIARKVSLDHYPKHHIGFDSDENSELTALSEKLKGEFKLNDGAAVMALLTEDRFLLKKNRVNWSIFEHQERYATRAALGWINLLVAPLVLSVFHFFGNEQISVSALFSLASVFLFSFLIHELAHWSETGFRWENRLKIIKGDLWKGGLGIPNAHGWSGILASTVLALLSLVGIFVFKDNSVFFTHALIINAVFAMSPTDWADLLSHKTHASQTINRALNGTPLSLGVAQVLPVEELTYDVVIPYASDHDWLEIKSLLERSNAAASITILVSDSTHQEEINERIAELKVNTPITIEIGKPGLFVNDQFYLASLDENIPAKLRQNVGNILLALPSGVRINPAGLNSLSLIYQMKLLPLSEILKESVPILHVTENLIQELLRNQLADVAA